MATATATQAAGVLQQLQHHRRIVLTNNRGRSKERKRVKREKTQTDERIFKINYLIILLDSRLNTQFNESICVQTHICVYMYIYKI